MKLDLPLSNELNEDGVFLQDIYLLSYCGLKIVLEVCKTYPHSVCVIELATKKYREGISLTKWIRPTPKPLLVVGQNTFEKSTYEVKTNRDKTLSIVITRLSNLFWEATKYVDCPLTGTFKAVPFPDYLNTYWKKPKKIKKDIDNLHLIN